jgi:hypothetical protein
MKRVVLMAAAALCIAGCSSSHNGRVTYREDGTKVYGLTSQPQVNTTGEGPLMRDVTGYRQSPGQFTGQEGTSSRVGDYQPVPPKSDARDLTHTSRPPQVGTGIVPPMEGAGAGSLGQAGIQPGNPVSSATIAATPSSLVPSASVVNPPTMATVPTLAEPLTRNSGANIDSTANAGRPSGPEIGTASSLRNNLPAPALSPPNDQRNDLNPLSTRSGIPQIATTDLATRVREYLESGQPGTISRLTPERVQNIDVETIGSDVTLRGVARSEVERLMIENKVARLPGVRSVNNQLQVLSPGREGTVNPSSPEERANILFREK